MRKKDDAERRKRSEAVVAFGEAATSAVRSREDNDAALRKVFEAALKSREDEDRAVKLRDLFEAAFHDSPQVLAAEVAAGEAVLAAAVLRVSQGDLCELCEQRPEDVRRWAQMARLAEQGSSAAAPVKPGQPQPAKAERPVTGFAVVAESTAGERDRDEDVVGADHVAAG